MFAQQSPPSDDIVQFIKQLNKIAKYWDFFSQILNSNEQFHKIQHNLTLNKFHKLSNNSSIPINFNDFNLIYVYRVYDKNHHDYNKYDLTFGKSYTKTNIFKTGETGESPIKFMQRFNNEKKFLGAYFSGSSTKYSAFYINVVYENSTDEEIRMLKEFKCKIQKKFQTITSGPTFDLLGKRLIYPFKYSNDGNNIKYLMKFDKDYIKCITSPISLNSLNLKLWNIYRPNENGYINCVIKVLWNNYCEDYDYQYYLISCDNKYLGELYNMLINEFVDCEFVDPAFFLDHTKCTVYDQNEFMNDLNQYYFGFEFIRSSRTIINISDLIIKYFIDF